MTDVISTNVNDPLARSFQTIVTGGWANQSDGSVESPTGHFALITIEPNERTELLDAFKGELQRTPYPGAYLLIEDSDGNATLTEYVSNGAAKRAYDQLDNAYTLWLLQGEPWGAEA